MPRIARLVVPDIPHHVTQRGNRRQRVFFSAGDGRLYLRLLREGCEKAGRVETVTVYIYPRTVVLPPSPCR